MQKNLLMKPCNQREGGEVCQGRDFVTTQPRRSRYHGIKLWWVVLFVSQFNFQGKIWYLSECHLSIWRSLNTVWCWECNGKVFVLFHCRGYREQTSKAKGVSHVFALRNENVMIKLHITVVRYLKKKKKMASLCEYLLCFVACRLLEEFRKACK